jgi:hypothetical protein
MVSLITRKGVPAPAMWAPKTARWTPGLWDTPQGSPPLIRTTPKVGNLLVDEVFDAVETRLTRSRRRPTSVTG